MLNRILSGLAALLIACGIAWGLQTTPALLVSPETGEVSNDQTNVVNVARLKMGFGTATAAGSGTAQTATLNAASGVITCLAFTVVSGAGASATLTLTNSKIQAGDIVFGMIDDTGATAASLLEVQAVQVAAGSAVFKIVNNFTTANLVAPKVMFTVFTKGNTGN